MSLIILVSALAACGSLSPAGDGGGDDDDDVTGDGGIGDGGGIDAPPGPCERDDLSIRDFLDCSGAVANELFERCVGDIGASDFRNVVGDFSFFGDLSIPLGKAFFPDAVDHGTIEYDPVAAQACLTSLREIPCFQLFGSSGEDVLEECAMFRGQIGAGGACFNELECSAVGSRCEKFCQVGGGSSELCCAGSCVPPIPLNGSCADGGRCVNGAHCVNGFCASGQQGAPCSGFDGDCDNAFWCNSTTCSTDFQAGAQCTKEAQCPGGFSCVGEDPDTGAAGTCVDVRVVDAPCDANGGGDLNFGCLDALFCDIPLAGDEGVCKPLPEVGDICGQSDENDQICPFILVCDENQCQNRGGTGDPCTNQGAGTCNLDHFCSIELPGVNEGECMEPQGAGSPCNNDGHCASGICNIVGECETYTSCFL